MNEFKNGDTIGNCIIHDRIEHTGMSDVYLAEQQDTGRTVAVKVMSPLLLSDPVFYQRFEREIKATIKLQHPHIIPIYNVGKVENLPYMVMAFVEGGSVEDLLSSGPLSVARAAGIISQVAEALDYAHANGIIHRDIKPANILLDKQENAILTDFGIAYMLADTQQITRDVIVGTPSYIAPEMISDDSPPGISTDIYGLGVTIYQMLTGRQPFVGSTPTHLMWAHMHEPPPSVENERMDAPEGTDVFIQKALAKNPAERYATAGELAADFAALAEGREPELAFSAPPTRILVGASAGQSHRLEDAVRAVVDQVVKIIRFGGGSGSGVIVPGNLVITCAHVVDGAQGLYVTFRTGERVEAEVLAQAYIADLALLRLLKSPETLPVEKLSGLSFECGEMNLGEPLAAIGHPLGLDWAVTGGHFNGIRQPGDSALKSFGIKLKVPLVQVDVAINPGNSGGPLITEDACLAGIADSVINPALASNIGFAVSGETAYEFWQANKDKPDALVAYSCGHHHDAGETFCPVTGSPVEAHDRVPMPSEESIRYSCGHIHEHGVDYCPLTGKPVTAIDELPAEENGEEPAAAASTDTICGNCGSTFNAIDRYCPACGRPASSGG